MELLVLAIISVVLSLACIAFSALRFKKISKTFSALREKSVDVEALIAQLEKKVRVLLAESASRRPALESSVNVIPDSVREQLQVLRMAVHSLEVQVDAHSRSIATLRQSFDQAKPQTVQPTGISDARGFPDVISQPPHPQQPISQDVLKNLLPDVNSPMAVSEDLAVKVSEESLASAQSPSLQESYEAATEQYQEAVNRSDRQALRRMQYRELNISSDSEDALTRGNITQATRLVAVTGGGSYMIVNSEDCFWLFPTALTLDSFSSAQPQKGIFNYEGALLTRPVVKKPAEVIEDGECWVITTLGVICVPS